jgi:hypothetical protein
MNSYERPNQEDGGSQEREKTAREYHGVLRFNLEQRAVLSGLLGIAGALGGSLVGKETKPLKERMLNSWKATGELEKWLDEGHFSDVKESYDSIIDGADESTEKERLRREFDEVRRSREAALDQEKKQAESVKSLVGILGKIF